VIGGAGALIVLAFVFASLLALVPIVMAVVSIMTTFLLLLGLAQITAVSPIVEFLIALIALIALIGLGVAIDYSLLMVSRWREERFHGAGNDEAVRRAIETAGRAVVFSGLTVAIGLLALIALPIPFLRSVGCGGVLIPLVSTLVAITLLAVLLATIGPRLDWPHRRTDDQASRAWTRWARAVARRRWVAAAGGLAVVVALALAATGLRLGIDDADTLASAGDAKLGLLALEQSGIGEGALLPTRSSSTTRPVRNGWQRRCAPSTASTAPSRRAPATGAAAGPRSSRRCRLPTADRTPAPRRSRAFARPPTQSAPACTPVANRRTTPTSSTPSTATSRCSSP
jgi:putative drug exporter of the RND superfamily